MFSRNDLEKLAAILPQDAVRYDVPMSEQTTLRLGGPADLLLEPCDTDEVRTIIRAAAELEIPLLTIGRGSNLLVRDGGIRGAVLSTRRMNQLSINGHILTAGAGVPLSVLAKRAALANLGGLVFAAGIPGSVGGAVRMNAGAYGGEMSKVVRSVTVVLTDGSIREMRADELCFAYRHSALQELEGVVTEAVFELPDGQEQQLLDEMAELNRRRREKQPLELPSAGSTFRRPLDGYASALIDQCGLKGCTIGGAQVSEKHAGFCVNIGGNSSDFMRLMEHIRQVVQEQTGTVLEPEVCIVGEDVPEEGERV